MLFRRAVWEKKNAHQIFTGAETGQSNAKNSANETRYAARKKET